MAREYSLFALGTPEEKLANGQCPQGRCVAKLNEGFVSEITPHCCCLHCYQSVNPQDDYCGDCPVKPANEVEDEYAIEDESDG